ncbi:MAG: hypothetical protein ACPGZP_05065 [Panacagrimonas sp.]
MLALAPVAPPSAVVRPACSGIDAALLASGQLEQPLAILFGPRRDAAALTAA